MVSFIDDMLDTIDEGEDGANAKRAKLRDYNAPTHRRQATWQSVIDSSGYACAFSLLCSSVCSPETK